MSKQPPRSSSSAPSNQLRPTKRRALRSFREERGTALRGNCARALPIHVLASEALELAAFVDQYFQPRTDDEEGPLPGLVSAGARLPSDAAGELRDIAEAVVAAHEKAVLCVADSSAVLARAAGLLRELRSAAEFFVATGDAEGPRRQLAALEQDGHARGRSADGIACQLGGLVRFLESYATELREIPAIAWSTIEAAKSVSSTLRERRFESGRAKDPAAAASAELRDRLAELLWQRLLHVRAVIRFVFRNHPRLVRASSSSFLRRRRAASRQRRTLVSRKRATSVQRSAARRRRLGERVIEVTPVPSG